MLRYLHSNSNNNGRSITVGLNYAFFSLAMLIMNVDDACLMINSSVVASSPTPPPGSDQGVARSPLLLVNSAKVRSNNKNTSQQQYDHTREISCRSAPICAESSNNMITPKINNNTACKARPRPAGIFHAHLPSFLPVWLALATPGDGTRAAARVRTRTSPPLHAPPIPLVHPTCVLTPPRLTAPPPCHRRLS